MVTISRKVIIEFLKSMRFVLLLLFLFVGIAPLIFFNVVIMNISENDMLSNRQDNLRIQCMMLKNFIAASGRLDLSAADQISSELSQVSSSYDRRVVIVDSNYSIVKDTYVMDEGKYCVTPSIIAALEGSDSETFDRDTYSMEFTMGLSKENSGSNYGVLFVKYSVDDIREIINGLRFTGNLVITIFCVLIIALAVFTSVMFSKPFKFFEKSIKGISEGNLEEKLSDKGFSETRNIAKAFNYMTETISETEARRQEFVSNVSHELRTPITSIKVLADSLLTQENIPVELYKEFMGDIVNEIDRESRIIEDLLTLVKMDKSAAEMNISKVNINDVVELVLRRVRPLAAKKNVELIYESFRPIVAEADETKITMAISNIVSNAVRYNNQEGFVRVTLNSDTTHFFVKVEDSGIGIPKEECERIFERFYRVDKARSRESGGTGLGLAITREIIQMHGGDIKVYSVENEGSTFTLRIPLRHGQVD